MLIRLVRKCECSNSYSHGCDYDLIDILRALSQHDRDTVIGRTWLVHEPDFYTYHDFDTDRLQLLVPNLPEGEVQSLIDGERLLERSALVYILELGLFLRVVDPQAEVKIDAEYRLHRGPSRFQATNVDLEIRRNEAPFEIVTEDEGIIAYLQWAFAVTEVED